MSTVLATTTATTLLLIVCAAFLLAAFFWGFNRWCNGKRWHEDAQRRPEPVEPNGFNEAILQYVVSKCRRRDEATLSADAARDDLQRVA